jgi:hypothetical protein
VRITQSDNGELTLVPAMAEDFGGSSLPAGWGATIHNPAGSATVNGGQLRLIAALAGSSTLLDPGHSLDFVATFQGFANEHVGFATDLNDFPFAIFSIPWFAPGTLYARTNGEVTALPGVALGVPHAFRIEWSATAVNYYVDGALVAQHGGNAAQLRPVASTASTDSLLRVDSMLMTPYTSPGTFTSRVFDAFSISAWGAATWDTTTLAGTSVVVRVRTGNTPVPDGSWSAFATITNSGDDVAGSSRYIQYEVVLSTTDPNVTPVLRQIAIAFQE